MSDSSRSLRADSRQTQEDILAASVELFSQKGFAPASMRLIAAKAGVNLALLNYHFGSKLNLFEASFLHCAAPINAERIRLLDELESNVADPTLEQIVIAFVDVGAVGDANWSRMIARVFVESDEISQPILERAFRPTLQRFKTALQRVLPEVEEETLEMRFHFLVGSMLHLIRFSSPLKLSENGRKNWGPNNGLDELVNFVVGGLRAGGSHQFSDRRV